MFLESLESNGNFLQKNLSYIRRGFWDSLSMHFQTPFGRFNLRLVSLPVFSSFSRQISKKHLNERQILAIQYISRGAYPSFANFCNRGEDYGWWEGGFSYQISLQDFEQCENHFPMCKKPKAPSKKRKKETVHISCTISIGFLVEPLFCHWFTTTRW